MKSNICEIKKDGTGLSDILDEVEKVSKYNGLDKKQSLRLRLLSEELNGMLSELVKSFEGIFWVENQGMQYELHVTLKADKMSAKVRDELISVSKSRKNAAAIGIMGKIRAAAEEMFLYSENDIGVVFPFDGFITGDLGLNFDYSYMWTLDQYREEIQNGQKKEEWDELERSIVAKLADDVIVGIRGRNIDIIIKKTFENKEENK